MHVLRYNQSSEVESEDHQTTSLHVLRYKQSCYMSNPAPMVSALRHKGGPLRVTREESFRYVAATGNHSQAFLLCVVKRSACEVPSDASPSLAGRHIRVLHINCIPKLYI
eukprot:TRINITY_DN831_c0_g4_i6.p2 TRINITY_DN831_c0_g4~~TRINITY_DN831_c0_g4_i6.p2  ORF type:complete len:110 (+),score=2.94 TRINITY_DN831_c0_g4_i6:628-957(+)